MCDNPDFRVNFFPMQPLFYCRYGCGKKDRRNQNLSTCRTWRIKGLLFALAYYLNKLSKSYIIMKNAIVSHAILFVALLLPSCSSGQFLEKVNEALNTTGSGGFTEVEAANAIKEALIQGTGKSVDIVSALDGYFKNPEIKIPFPPEAANVESKLRAIGLGSEVDKAILSINRAAEDAAKEAAPIFIAAIKNMTIADAIGIVKGNQNAATLYLSKTTGVELKRKFSPVIKNSLDKVNATRYWTDIMNAYNKIPFVQKMNPDLSAYVTDKAIEGLFVMVAKEELKIRKDPVARTTELLRKVFGNQ